MLNIIEVRKLPNNFKNPYVKLKLVRHIDGRFIEEDIGQTQVESRDNPVFNHRC
jgi:hypothetical protein